MYVRLQYNICTFIGFDRKEMQESNPRKRSKTTQLENILAKYLQVVEKHSIVGKIPEEDSNDLQFFKLLIPHFRTISHFLFSSASLSS